MPSAKLEKVRELLNAYSSPVTEGKFHMQGTDVVEVGLANVYRCISNAFVESTKEAVKALK